MVIMRRHLSSHLHHSAEVFSSFNQNYSYDRKDMEEKNLLNYDAIKNGNS